MLGYIHHVLRAVFHFVVLGCMSSVIPYPSYLGFPLLEGSVEAEPAFVAVGGVSHIRY